MRLLFTGISPQPLSARLTAGAKCGETKGQVKTQSLRSTADSGWLKMWGRRENAMWRWQEGLQLAGRPLPRNSALTFDSNDLLRATFL